MSDPTAATSATPNANAGTPAAAADPDPAAGVPGALPTGAPATDTQGSVPATRPNALLAATTDKPPEHHGIPEKHRVFKADGTLDTEASAAKVASAYNERETQLGKIGKAPAAPGDYVITPPENLDVQFEPEEFEGFMREAHAAGMTQPQMDVVSKNFFTWADRIINAQLEFKQEECEKAMGEIWKTAEERTTGFLNAKKTFDTFCGDQSKSMMIKYGNDPEMLQMTAAVGAQIKESSSLPAATTAAAAGNNTTQMYADLESPDPDVRKRAEAALADYSKRKAAERAA